jgi:hypothetical protein
MRRRETGQYGVRFYESWRRHEEGLAGVQASFELTSGSNVALMPGAESSNHAAGIDEEPWHFELAGQTTLARERLTSLLNSFGREIFCVRFGNRDQEATFPHEPDLQRLRLDLDSSVAPAHIECHPRLDSCLSPDLFRNYQSPGRIYGTFHGMILP